MSKMLDSMSTLQSFLSSPPFYVREIQMCKTRVRSQLSTYQLRKRLSHTVVCAVELKQNILDFAEGLRAAGILPNEKISLFADNSCRWMIADQGIMATGAVGAVRGSRSSVKELLQIYTHSDSVALVIDNPGLLNMLAPKFTSSTKLRFIVLLWGEKSERRSSIVSGVPIYTFDEIMDLGHEKRQELRKQMNSGKNYNWEVIKEDDVATLVYTSGTTGNPKAVMLTHRNLLYQICHLQEFVPTSSRDRILTLLPPWHMYERTIEYYLFTHGTEQYYTNVKFLKEDLKLYQPHYMAAVPLVYDTIFRGIQKQISSTSAARRFIAMAFMYTSMMYMEFKRIYEGRCLAKAKHRAPFIIAILDCFLARILAAMLWPLHMLAKRLLYNRISSAIGLTKAGITGGGSLPNHIEHFYEAIGITMINGYGLTETSPVLTGRRADCNVLGTVGRPLQGTELKIVDPETGESLKPGRKGIVKVRGPQVMKGYYKNAAATEKVLDSDGWLDTGDIGWLVPHSRFGGGRKCGGMLVLEGRAKDTIVLSTGENVEPVEIEEAATQSDLIEQIVVVGQDQRRLGALIVTNKEEMQIAIEAWKKANNPLESIEKIMNRLVRHELDKYTSSCSFHIGPFLLLDEPFTIESGLLTPTLKVRREVVNTKFQAEIARLFE
eukprot:TRINITY_DN6544_c0_g1_i2.p1 TRINITY_DN6544_c0_g1~~TRINITY_DN6544_c0_g1_i2.p1  ORF type:complete len:662 (+),score=118.31 TRINITY_DN6544_c0_g1_i2:137-2122(+)